MSIWLCPDCHGCLDRRESLTIDLDAAHDNRRCATCGTPRLRLAPAPDDHPDAPK